MLILYGVHGVLEASTDFPNFQVECRSFTPFLWTKLLVTWPEYQRLQEEPADELLWCVDVDFCNLVAFAL